MKKRIIPSVLLKSGTSACISQEFVPWRTVGTLAQNLRLHVSREADELLIINSFMNSVEDSVSIKRIFNLVRKSVDIPISYTGGINNVSDANFCINSGFDKIYITNCFYNSHDCIKDIVNVIGSQSLGICLPYRRNTLDNIPILWNYKQKKFTKMSLKEAVIKAIALEVGELLLYDVDKDGSLKGMDLEIINILDDLKCNLPILLAGGLGNEMHAHEALSSYSIQGLVVGSAFSLTKTTPSTIRSFCSSKGISMRQV